MNRYNYSVRKRSLIKKALTYFFRGLLIFVPLATAIYILYLPLGIINDKLLAAGYKSPFFLSMLVLACIVVGIVVLGYLGSNYLTKPFLEFFEDKIEKTPGVKFIYSSVKDILAAFVGDKKKFSEPVMVELNNPGVYKIGFITRKDLTALGLEGYSGVYFPKSYGFVGDLYLVKNERIKPMDANPTDVFKMVVSGGLSEIEDPSA